LPDGGSIPDPAAAEQLAEKVALQSEEQPQRLAELILWHLRRGLKPRPFKTKSKLEFSSNCEAACFGRIL
jgi:hypothetical protein